jgi:hypothetical protein
VTWGIVVYPAWDDWTEANPAVRAAVEDWLFTWVEAGPPTGSEHRVRQLESIDRVVNFESAVHEPTGVEISFFTGGRIDGDEYIAVIDLPSPGSAR